MYIYICANKHIFICIYIYKDMYIYIHAVPHPHHTTGGAGNIAPVYPYPFLLLTTTHYYILLTTTNPPTPLPTHRGGRGT